MLRERRQSGSLPSYGGGSSNGHGEGGFGVGYGGASSAGGYGGGGGYGASSNGHHPYAQDNKYANKRRSSQSNVVWSLLKDKFVVVCILCVSLFCSTLYYRGNSTKLMKKLGAKSIKDAHKQLHSHHSERDQWRKDTKRNIQDSRALEDKNRRLEEKNGQLEKDTQDLKKQLQKATEGEKSSEGHKKTVEHYAKRDAAWRHQVQKLQNATARESKRTVLEHYGPGPHRVKFSVLLPDERKQDPNKVFVVELAPLDMMPHAIHLFLEQIDHELWDNTWFYLNGPHVLQAGPQAYEDENDPDDEAKLHEFTKRELATLSFPEYNPSFPHVQWSIGFTGRPGGPDWYINKADNSRLHGPGGQRQHTLLEQADPCFAKVVEGFGVLENLFKLEVYHEDDYQNFYVDPVQITTARLVVDEVKMLEEAKKAEEQKKQEEKKKEEEKKKQEEHHPHGKPIKSHRTDVEDDDFLDDEDWDDDYLYHDHHDDHVHHAM